jgi:hypothetical protein
MGTSKSTEAASEYTGGASLFSGRRDPAWQVGRAEAERLQSLWEASEPFAGALPFAPPLGYRGCFLRDAAEREWFAYRGVVTLKSPEGSASRRDENREFESLLLSTAPEGLIMPELLDAELRREE